jgi:DNA sulfur modification protein DndC
MGLQLNRRAEAIQRLYLADQRPWVIAFSGGKDSTAVLQLIWWAIHKLGNGQRSKPIHVCYVDTGMEYPAFASQITAALDAIEAASLKQQMPFVVRRLEPELKHRYFPAVIGRGYAPPTHWFRWCTKGMRVKPMNAFIKQTIDVSGDAVLVLGLRAKESNARRATLRKFATSRKFEGRYGALSKALVFTPIEDMSTDEVWQFLMQFPCPWGGSNRALAQLYRDGAGECLTNAVVGDRKHSCGGSRFGCWTCTVVRTDKAGGALAQTDDRYLDLLGFRDWIAKVRYEPEARWKRRRNGNPGPGPLRLSIRRTMLRKLLTLERDTGFDLIRKSEVAEIQRFWTLDGDRSDTALRMFREMGRNWRITC